MHDPDINLGGCGKRNNEGKKERNDSIHSSWFLEKQVGIYSLGTQTRKEKREIIHLNLPACFKA